MRKLFIFSIAAVALIFAFISFDTASNNNVFEIVVNNTNLAPDAGSPHPFGTGERISNVTYYTNLSAIELFVFAHAQTASQTANIILYINGTEISHVELRPLGSSEQTHSQIIAIIPKGVSYNVSFSNYHHYEWREYPILSGKNGTLSINQTIFNNYTNITNGSQINNGSIQINESQVNNLTTDLNSKVNKSGDNLTGSLSFVNLNHSFSGLQGIDFPQYDVNTILLMLNRQYNVSALSWECMNIYSCSYSGISLQITAFNNSNTSYFVGYGFNNNSANFIEKFQLGDTLKLSQSGKGITLYAPNGNPWCTTVTNGGTLNTAAGVCT